MKFAHPVDEHTAAELEAVALEVSPELHQVYDGEMLPKSIRKAIRETGELKLWWDDVLARRPRSSAQNPPSCETRSL
jgi:hypothetical protein